MGSVSETANWSLPLIFPAFSGICEICGESHDVEKCTLIEGIKDHVQDSPSLSYARLTLPEGLEVRELSDGNKTVIAAKPFSKGLKFGPFIAKTSTLIDVRIEFPLRVFLSEEESVYLETYEEIFCNWMCLVLPASCVEEQNMICFQIKTGIYFCSLREIKKGEELRVWYAPYYAKRIGANLIPKSANLIDSSDEEFQEIFESLQTNVEIQDHQYLPKSKTKRKLPKKPVLVKNYNQQVPPSDILPEEFLGAPRRSEWECSTCGKVEINVAAYARHLMTHYRPAVKSSLRCPHCNVNFRKDGYNRRIHLGVCERKKQEQSAKDESQNPSNLNKMVFIIRDVGSDKADSEPVQKYCESSLEGNVWKDSIGCEKSSDNSVNNSQTLNKNKEEVLQNCKGNKSLMMINIDTASNELGISNQKEVPCLNVYKSNGDENDKGIKSFEHLQSNESNSNGNLHIKPKLHPPILDLSDDIDFHLTKSLDEMINDDCNLDKSLPFNKNRSLDLFGPVEGNLLGANVPNAHSSTETTSYYSLEKNGFLQSDFACNDVTEEERNRIVENLLSETDDHFFASDYDMTDDCVSDNAESQAKASQSSVEKNGEKDKERRSQVSGDYKCDICSKCFTKSRYLLRHLRKHTGEFRCNTCLMVFARKENLQNHSLSCSKEAETQETVRRGRVLCIVCRQQFESLSSLRDHMEEHYCNGNTWKCKCNETSESPDLFMTHKCPLNKSVKCCTKCGKSFHSQQEFVEHKNYPTLKIKKRADDRSLLCELCGVLNKTAKGARNHRNSFHAKIHKCNVCKKTFSAKEKLKDHLAKHEKPNLEECPVCSKMFPSKTSCLKHQQRAHANPCFTCTYCKREFRQKSNFNKHVARVHEKNFACSLCDLEFANILRLDKHLKQKHFEQVILCKECDKPFLCMWKLKEHNRQIHYGEMYKCKYCNAQTKYKNALRRHLRAFHEDKKEEWVEPDAIDNMKMHSERAAVSQLTQGTEVVTSNDNASSSNILQAAAENVIDDDKVDMNDGEAVSQLTQGMEVVMTNGNPSISNILQTAAENIIDRQDDMNDGEAVSQLTQGMEVVMTNGNPSISNILQTAAENIIDRQDDMNDVTEESMDCGTQITRMELLSNTNFETTIIQNMSDTVVPQEITLDLNALQGSENVAEQLVSIDGEVIKMPLAFVNSQPTAALMTQDESSIAGQAEMLSYPVILPEGCLLTLDNSMLVEQPMEESSTPMDVGNIDDVNSATSAFVLTEESGSGSNLQLENNVLFFIVDTSIPNILE